MWFKWFPWRFIVRHLARRHGFLDPFSVWAYFRRFARPSEVAEPIELLRAGVVFHARGLMNSRAIQQNLDWVWPYWIDRQFDPRDPAFVPRAFSLTHINLTHRNWTAVGLPTCPELPLVDPRGLLTPYLDGWSLDGWLMNAEGRLLAPSQLARVEQKLRLDPYPAVVTRCAEDGFDLTSEARVEATPEGTVCRLALTGTAPGGGWLIVALRPYNPEGIQFIHEVVLNPERDGWNVDGDHRVLFSAPADRHRVSEYHSGDVSLHLREERDDASVVCNVGMATAAAMFDLGGGPSRRIEVSIPLDEHRHRRSEPERSAEQIWSQALDGHCRVRVPNEQWQFLYDAAIRTILLHTSETIWPGPYTYKRFWFRDAAYILHGMHCAGLIERAGRLIEQFPSRQTVNGYFHSQEGEWDANGQTLWIMDEFSRLSGRAPSAHLMDSIEKGARWIARKRVSGKPETPHAGLMPPGFSAEHLGPNDYYYWDDFWSVAGLRAAARIMRRLERGEKAARYEADASELMGAIEKSLRFTRLRLGRTAIPASPYRRLDSGAIGSIAADYPTQLWPAADPRVMDTMRFLLDACLVHGGFFQDMIHSGINAYLTLQMAQVLLRAGDARHESLMDAVARLASPTGQWPEAIHPHTGGGCMGDGQHVWAAAEWVTMLRNCLVREEEIPPRLILGSGIPATWLAPAGEVEIGPTPTPWGPISVRFQGRDGAVEVSWEGRWRVAAPAIEVRAPGWPPQQVDAHCSGVLLRNGDRQ